MAKGITESDVHQAADALVATGGRPTVERIRAHLGTGSPNTVTRWLETWWQGLGSRLAAQHAKLALPGAPDDVVALASQWWAQASAAAQQQAEAMLADERGYLETRARELAEQEAAWQAQIHEQAAIAEKVRQLLALAEQRLADAHHLAEQQAMQISDLGQHRTALQVRCERLERDLAAMEERVRLQDAAAVADRDAYTQHVRATEDRAHAEIDRARQEAKGLQTQLMALRQEQAATEKLLRQQRDDALAAAASAQREAGLLRGRAEALEQQLARLGDLSTTLQATLARAHETVARRGGRTAAITPVKRKAKRKRSPSPSK